LTEYHEPWESLPADVKDTHRAIKSLQEELEAVDWYNQRVAVCTDPELKAILAHNRDEEIEHAAMVLEWLRRRLPAVDENLRTYLFREGSILHAEAAATGKSEGGGATTAERNESRSGAAGVGLGLGGLRGSGGLGEKGK
jgi:ferritin-like protein